MFLAVLAALALAAAMPALVESRGASLVLMGPVAGVLAWAAFVIWKDRR